MLRIVTEQHGDLYKISLHGKLAGEWVPLLERYWQCLAEKVSAARITTVLSDVPFIDADGQRLLQRMARCGVDLIATGCMNRHLIDRIRKAAGRDH